MFTGHLVSAFTVTTTNFTKFSCVIEPCCFFLFKTMKIQTGLVQWVSPNIVTI